MSNSLAQPSVTMNLELSTSEVTSAEVVHVDKSILEIILNPISYKDLIEDASDDILAALSKLNTCSCIHFTVDDQKSLEEIFTEAHRLYDCLSDNSSDALYSEDEDEDAAIMIKAVLISESRKSTDERRTQFSEVEMCFPSKSKSIRHPKSNIEKLSQSGGGEDPNNQSNDRKLSLEPFFKFHLPTNFENLEGISPLEYLDKYSWTCEARILYYQKELFKLKEIKDNPFSLSKLYQFLNAVMMNTLLPDQFSRLCKILNITKKTKIQNNKMFIICAIAERLFYFSNLSTNGEIALGITKGYQEMIDFQFIGKRMHDYDIQVTLKTLLCAL